ncbi:hypothetical protein HAX54_013601, partial [Datura stramonium]|nr:hypothetical protein [Datura stramonium]
VMYEDKYLDWRMCLCAQGCSVTSAEANSSAKTSNCNASEVRVCKSNDMKEMSATKLEGRCNNG